MAEEEEEEVHVDTGSNNPVHSHYLEIVCKSSGKIRRFAVGTKAGFALQLINRKSGVGKALSAYIEAGKEGEEPIVFGPSAVLVDYGDGWTLQTVLDQGFEKEKEEPLVRTKEILMVKPSPDVIQKTVVLNRSTSSNEGSFRTTRNISYEYIGRILVVLIFIIMLGSICTLALENLPRLILFINSSM